MDDKKVAEEIPFTMTEAEANFMVDCFNAVALNGQQSMARIGLIAKLNNQFAEHKKKEEGGKRD
jgi:hypothetical protein